MDDFLSKYGMQVATGTIAIGETYPIFGMITEILDETPGEVIVQINFSILARLNLSEPQKIETLKQRAFEPGIFVSTVTEQSADLTKVDCQTVVFGKKPSYSA